MLPRSFSFSTFLSLIFVWKQLHHIWFKFISVTRGGMKNNNNSIRPEKDASAKLKSILAQPSVSKTVKKKLRINVVPVIKEIPNNYEVLVAAERQLLEEVYQALKELLILRGVRFTLLDGRKRPLTVFLYYPHRKNCVKRTRSTTSTSSAAFTEATQNADTDFAVPSRVSSYLKGKKKKLRINVVPVIKEISNNYEVLVAAERQLLEEVYQALKELLILRGVRYALPGGKKRPLNLFLHYPRRKNSIKRTRPTTSTSSTIPAGLPEATQDADTVFAGPPGNSSLLSRLQTFDDPGRPRFYCFLHAAPILSPSSLLFCSATMSNFSCSTNPQIESDCNYRLRKNRPNVYAFASSPQSSYAAFCKTICHPEPPPISLTDALVAINAGYSPDEARAMQYDELDKIELKKVEWTDSNYEIRRRQKPDIFLASMQRYYRLPPEPLHPTFLDFILEYKIQFMIISVLSILFMTFVINFVYV